MKFKRKKLIITSKNNLYKISKHNHNVDLKNNNLHVIYANKELSKFFTQENNKRKTEKRRNQKFHINNNYSDICIADIEQDPVLIIEKRDLVRRILEIISTLPAKQKNRIRMIVFEEKTIAEVAKIEGLSVQAIYKDIERIKSEIVNKL